MCPGGCLQDGQYWLALSFGLEDAPIPISENVGAVPTSGGASTKGRNPSARSALPFPHLRGSPRVEQSPLYRTKASIWLTEAALNLQGFDQNMGCSAHGRGKAE